MAVSLGTFIGVFAFLMLAGIVLAAAWLALLLDKYYENPIKGLLLYIAGCAVLATVITYILYLMTDGAQ